MKKVLLGLLAISAVAMAEGGNTPASASEQTVDVITTANVINSGLVITKDEYGNTKATEVTLDHGTIAPGGSEVTETIYIRRAAENTTKEGVDSGRLPDDAIIDIELAGTRELYLDGDINATDKIAHTLTANVTGAKKISGDDLEIDDSTDNIPVKGKFEVNGNVKIDLISDIADTYTSAAEGDYSNTTILKVRYSKRPETSASIPVGR